MGEWVSKVSNWLMYYMPELICSNGDVRTRKVPITLLVAAIDSLSIIASRIICAICRHNWHRSVACARHVHSIALTTHAQVDSNYHGGHSLKANAFWRVMTLSAEEIALVKFIEGGTLVFKDGLEIEPCPKCNFKSPITWTSCPNCGVNFST